MIQKFRHYASRYLYHRTRRMLPELHGGQAAGGQDLLVAQLLGHKRNGVFFDIGANDGVTISNTLYLERELGWNGVAVEPIPRVFERLKSNRDCHVVNGCVAPKPGKAKFLEVVGGPNMLSTLAIHDVGLTRRRLRKNAQRTNATIAEQEVECYSFASLVRKYRIEEIDFLSVDTEGGELEILESIDFDTTPVKFVSVENNYYASSIRRFMERSGFLYVGTFKVDELYVFGGTPLREAMVQMANAA